MSGVALVAPGLRCLWTGLIQSSERHLEKGWSFTALAVVLRRDWIVAPGHGLVKFLRSLGDVRTPAAIPTCSVSRGPGIPAIRRPHRDESGP